jgi:cytochrome c oxidase accessory protein FixG
VLVCPYGRLQGVMLDSNSLVVAYDYKRGEPRGASKKNETGDCIDCNSCVAVCPTGIDVRNGTQLECINCTACIDACNSVMNRIGLPEGLIRIASENGIKFGTKFKFTPRIIFYTSIVTLLLSALVVLFTVRSQVESTILRVPGTLYNEISETEVSNIYNFKTINKTSEELTITIKLLSHEGKLLMIGSNFTLPENDKLEGVFLLIMEKGTLESSNSKVEFGIYSGDELLETIKSTFVGP